MIVANFDGKFDIKYNVANLYSQKKQCNRMEKPWDLHHFFVADFLLVLPPWKSHSIYWSSQYHSEENVVVKIKVKCKGFYRSRL